MTTKDSERVQVWNTFFKLARDSGMSLKKLQKPSWEGSERQFSGGTLDDKKMGSLALVAWCFLALESRTNHLLEELHENGALSKKEVEAIRFLSTDRKWALLPKLAGKTSPIDFSQSPHSCVTELSGLRNDLFHVNYDRLLNRLPSPVKALSLFNQFVRAMEDMNVVLGRHEQEDPLVLGFALDDP